MTTDIPTVRVEFKGLPDFICTLKWWKEIGGYHKWLSLFTMSPINIKKVHYCLMDVKDYPTEVWEG